MFHEIRSQLLQFRNTTFRNLKLQSRAAYTQSAYTIPATCIGPYRSDELIIFGFGKEAKHTLHQESTQDAIFQIDDPLFPHSCVFFAHITSIP